MISMTRFWTRRHAALMSGLMALCGFLVAGMINSTELGRIEAEFSVAAGLGAAVAGAIVSPCFGRRGVAGWGLACLGAVLATVLGAGFAVVFVGGLTEGSTTLEIVRTLPLGPVFVIAMILSAAPVAVAWVFGMLNAQAWAIWALNRQMLVN